MKTDKQKILGVFVMFLSLLAFFSFFIHFNFDGATPDVENIPLALKIVFTMAIIPIGLYAGLYLYAGKTIANQIGGGMGILLILALLIAFFRAWI